MYNSNERLIIRSFTSSKFPNRIRTLLGVVKSTKLGQAEVGEFLNNNSELFEKRERRGSQTKYKLNLHRLFQTDADFFISLFPYNDNITPFPVYLVRRLGDGQFYCGNGSNFNEQIRNGKAYMSLVGAITACNDLRSSGTMCELVTVDFVPRLEENLTIPRIPVCEEGE